MIAQVCGELLGRGQGFVAHARRGVQANAGRAGPSLRWNPDPARQSDDA